MNVFTNYLCNLKTFLIPKKKERAGSALQQGQLGGRV